jgi:signal peptidase I
MSVAAHDESSAVAEPPKRRLPRGVAFARDLLIIFVVAILLSTGIKTFLVRSFFIPSGSMQNTLQIDDRILVNELVPGLAAVERGDVIVFKDPGGWLPTSAPQQQTPVGAFLEFIGLAPSSADDHLIKRVIGLPGDTVECCNELGQLSVNGVPLDESEYVLLPAGNPRVSQDDFSVVVPDDRLWVMGDNRYNSKDSRYNTETPSEGFVPMDNVVGKAFVVVWPLDRWTWLGNYPMVFSGTDG